MKTKLFFACLFFTGSYMLSAQSISRSVVNSIGGASNNADVKLTSNVGDLIIGLTGSENSTQLSSGFLPALDLTVLSVEENTVNAMLIYPNPTTDKLFISNKNVLPLEIVIYSATGQLIKSAKSSQSQADIDVSNLAKGVYLVNITTPGNKNNSYKIIKN